MPNKNTIKVTKARERRAELTKQPLRIKVPVELRTLKRSARKQMERERAPSLWIMPWIDYTHAGGLKGRVYPPNHLLGLPTEVRQTIMYCTYSIAELETDTRKMKWDDHKSVKRSRKHVKHGRNHKTRSPDSQTMPKSLQETVDVSNHQAKLVTVLSRWVGVLKQISPLVQSEAEYVSKRWQEDLEAHIQRNLKVNLQELGWLLQPNLQPYMKPKQGQVVKSRERGPGRRGRHMKCWYCTERHGREDKICPMARRDPKEWEKTTKQVGGWRGREQDKLRLQAEAKAKAKKVVFE